MPNDYNINVIIIAKPPIKGLAKTRLSYEIGDKSALKIYSNLLVNTLKNVGKLNRINRFIYTDDEISFFSNKVGNRFNIIAELKNSKLSEKVYHAFQQSFNFGDYSIITVADDYFSNLTCLTEAIEKVCDNKVVLGPTLDGGLFLIAISREQLSLLDNLPFGCSNLYDILMKRVIKDGYLLHLLKKHIDIDTKEHLEVAMNYNLK